MIDIGAFIAGESACCAWEEEWETDEEAPYFNPDTGRWARPRWGSKPPFWSLLGLHKAMTLQAMTLHRVILVGMGLHKAKPPVHPVLGTLEANPHKSLSKATIEIGNLGGGIGQLATQQKLSTSGSLTEAGKAGRAALAGDTQPTPLQSLDKAHGHSLLHQQSLGKASQGHLQGQGMRHPSLRPST